MTWTKLLKYSAIAGAVILALVNLFAGVIPPLVVFVLLWIGSVFWLGTATKGPAILLLVSFLAFAVMSAPFALPAFAVPASAGDFILNLGAYLAALVGIAAAIAVLRGRAGSTGAARSVGLGAGGLFLVASIFSVFAAATYDDAVMQEGDIELVTKDSEYQPVTIEAEEGEISIFVDNEDATLHTFTIDELDVDLDVPASKSARVTFDAEPGRTYEFFCVPHESEGMEGTLRVE